MPRMRAASTLSLLLLSLLLNGQAAAAVCDATGEDAPRVTTLMASRTDPKRGLWIVAPSCVVEQLALAPNTANISISAKGIDEIHSLPTDLRAIRLSQNMLRNGARIPDHIETLWIEHAVETLPGEDNYRRLDLSSLQLPDKLKTLVLVASQLTRKSIQKLAMPQSLHRLVLTQNAIQSLDDITLPPRLQYLSLNRNKLLRLNTTLPETLLELDLSVNNFANFERLRLPPKLQLLNLESSNLRLVRGIRWPASLRKLRLKHNVVTNFEIRQSDLAVFQRLSEPTHAQVSLMQCADPTAAKVDAKTMTLCVISDARFDQKYGLHSATSPSGVISARGGSNSERDAASSSSSPSVGATTVLIAALCLVAVVALIAGAWQQRRRLRHRGEATVYQLRVTPSESTVSAKEEEEEEGEEEGEEEKEDENYLANDLRNDPEIIPFRLDVAELTIQSVIGHGAFAIVHAGTYHQRPVAVKQLQPGVWRTHSAVLTAFMDEIRLCAALDHPKIVTFIGVAWTTLRDISVVTELMTGGDLHTVLMSQQCVISTNDWVDRWPARSPQVQSKLAIALDVAEAVVYLHSFQRPVLHRDLKAKNVLLDARGHAKLSDFGISRAMPEDEQEMLTREVGTAAWTAPEVLRGERYTELADVYSFGVLLVEMDTCRHPYETIDCVSSVDDWGSHDGSATDDEASGGGLAMLLQLSTGELRPSVSSLCPDLVRDMVERCLQYKPDDRPTAMEIAHELRQLFNHGDGLGSPSSTDTVYF